MRLAKVLIAVFAVAVLLLVGAFWLSNIEPARPNGVDERAVFLWAPRVGLPSPRRGEWLWCNLSAGEVYCSLSSIDGKELFQSRFVPHPNLTPISHDQLNIDVKKTEDSKKFWVNKKLVPIVHLQNGTLLLPSDVYEDALRTVKN